MQVRCKMKCTSRVLNTYGVAYHFEAVCADEVPENQRYHKYTPSGSIDIVVTNENVDYVVGDEYYFDSNPVKVEPSAEVS